MDVKLLVLMFCGLNVYSALSQLIHIQSCRRASLDTRCLLTYIQNVTGELTNQVLSQNESLSRKLVAQNQLLVNTSHHLANKTELNNVIEQLRRLNQTLNHKAERLKAQIDEISQQVTSQNDILSDGLESLATENELNTIKDELTWQNQALVYKTEGLETRIEEISQQVTRQSDILSDGIEGLAAGSELIDEIARQNQALTHKTDLLETKIDGISRKVTRQSDLLSNGIESLPTETELNSIINELARQNLVLTRKTDGLENKIDRISRKVTSTRDGLQDLATTTALNNAIEELTRQNQELTSKTETQMLRITNQNELFASEILSKMNHVLSLVLQTSVPHSTTPDATEANTATVPTLNDETFPENCLDIYKLGETTSGVYTIYEPQSTFQVSQGPTSNRKAIDVYCDQDDTNGGPGWLVIQRRQDDSVSFNRTWNEYREGFGIPTGNVWLGNQNLAIITGGNTTYELRIGLEDWSNERRYARYSTFRVLGESDLFKLLLGEYSGDAGGDAMSEAKNRKFSTPDRDNDASSLHCAQKYYWAGFWYGNCGWAHLNNPYSNTANVAYKQGIYWGHWHVPSYSLKAVQMKIRPI